MAFPRQTFPKSEKIRTKSEIDRVFRMGTRFSCKGMALRIAPGAADLPSRVVFVAVRGFKGAVQRNRAKRVAREAWRLNKTRILPGRDVAVILFPEIEDFADVVGPMLSLFRKAGLLR